MLNQKESLYRLHIHDNIYYKVKENDPKFNKSKYKSELLVIKFDILQDMIDKGDLDKKYVDMIYQLSVFSLIRFHSMDEC